MKRRQTKRRPAEFVRSIASPLRYPGGKAALAEFIAGRITECGLSTVRYAEPYAGGAGAGLTLLFKEKVERILINDLDPAVYSFWRHVLDRTDQLVEWIETVPVSVEEFKKQQDIYRTSTRWSFKLGRAFFFLNRCTRSGIALNGGPIGGVRQDGKWKIDARFNRKALKWRVERIALFRERIEVSRDDGEDCIRRLQSENDSDTFALIDPPYFIQGQNLYHDGMSDGKHGSLAKCLRKKHRHFRWIVTYDKHVDVLRLYKKWQIRTSQVRYSAHSSRNEDEYLVLDTPT